MICENSGIFTLITVLISVIVYHVLTQMTILFFKLVQEIVGKVLEMSYFTGKTGNCTSHKIFMVRYVVKVATAKRLTGATCVMRMFFCGQICGQGVPQAPKTGDLQLVSQIMQFCENSGN